MAIASQEGFSIKWRQDFFKLVFWIATKPKSESKCDDYFFPIFVFFQSLAIFPEWWTFQNNTRSLSSLFFFSSPPLVIPRGYLVGTCRVPQEMCLENINAWQLFWCVERPLGVCFTRFWPMLTSGSWGPCIH